jgi:RNA 2',3'-cyclic 3'-phosphodiesterase
MSSDKRNSNRVESVRTFVCIEIPETIKGRIERLQQTLKQSGAQVSWTKPSNIHLTIKFLGDVRRERIDDACEAIERAASAVNEFEIEVAGAGCFPSPKNPRVLWVGLSNLPDELRRLHRAVEDELARKGFAREAKKFSPHLTIGRVRAPQNSAPIAGQLIEAGFEPESFRATEVIVMRSDLNPTGSIYTPQAKIKLVR